MAVNLMVGVSPSGELHALVSPSRASSASDRSGRLLRGFVMALDDGTSGFGGDAEAFADPSVMSSFGSHVR